jgi:hypothetical protein
MASMFPVQLSRRRGASDSWVSVRWLWLTALTGAPGTSCKADTSHDEVPPPWEIEHRVVGGIGGLDEQTKLNSEGHVMVRCFRRDLQLDAAGPQLAQARDLLRTAKREGAIRSPGAWAENPWKTEPEAADAYYQSFELTYEGHTHSMRDRHTIVQPVVDLMRLLDALRDEACKASPDAG